jgi:hypothetical protein
LKGAREEEVSAVSETSFPQVWELSETSWKFAQCFLWQIYPACFCEERQPPLHDIILTPMLLKSTANNENPQCPLNAKVLLGDQGEPPNAEKC